ncbi:MAG: futalosine hydrolase [Desulfobacteraceae bacterium]|nr:futalosine hydrolase [Desulfobacteraceae bacterium]
MSKGLILCATQFEMAGFLDRCTGLVKRKTPSGLTLYSGILNHTPFDCMISGPGVFNTAHGLTVYLEHVRPKLILNTGIAGSFGSGAGYIGGGVGIGDIGIADQEQYIHTGVGCDTHLDSCLPFDLIENHPLTRRGIYPADPQLLDIYHGVLIREFSDSVARGNFITVSSITASWDHAQKIYKRFSSVMEAMEGAAAFHVAALYQVPIIEIRAASNFVGERDKARWDFSLACDRVRQICEIVVGNGFRTTGFKTKKISLR